MKSAVRLDFPARASTFRTLDLPAIASHSITTLGKGSLPLLLLVLAALVLAACSAVTRPAPVRQTYLLEPPAPQPLAQSHPGALRVGTINVAAPFRGKAFVYRLDELRFETDFYVEFLVPPAAMLTEQTARALAHARPFARVTGPGGSGDAEWVLDGFASALYADTREAGKPAAELALTFYLTPAGGSAQTPVWTREYRKHAPMRDSSPVAYAEALNAAFGEIVGELARDLATVSLPARQASSGAVRMKVMRIG
jgi:cholesterol transport system auxiliary component